jgi:hypothetical protein
MHLDSFFLYTLFSIFSVDRLDKMGMYVVSLWKIASLCYLLDWQSYSLVGPKGAFDLRSQWNTRGLI